MTEEEKDALRRALDEYEDMIINAPYDFRFDDTEEDAKAELALIESLRKKLLGEE